MNSRLFRLGFLKLLCFACLVWTIFVICSSIFTPKSIRHDRVLHENIAEIAPMQINNFQVFPREEYDGRNFEVQINEEIQDFDEELVEVKPKISRTSIPKPVLSDDILELHRRLNLTNPGFMGEAVLLPENLDADIERMVNQSMETYKINEFISTLVPLDRELPDIRTDYCKQMTYSQNLPMASVIMVFHNEPLSMILRSVYSVLNRSPEHLIREILLIDDCSTLGEFLMF
jgi:Glycosyl transferase family 2